MRASLRFKSMIVGSPLESAAKRFRWILATAWPNLELAEILLEERRLPLVLSQLLSRTSNVLDVGCHIGSFLSLVRQIAPDGHHVAIEASPVKARLLSQKFRDVRIEQIAISDSSGMAMFEDNVAHPGFSRLQGDHPSDRGVKVYEVSTSTLDSLNLGSFDLVKLDIEGAELSALRGGAKFFKTQRPAIIFECGAAANVGLDRSALYDQLLLEMRYDVFTFSDFLYRKGPLTADEFRKCGIYPFKAFNFLALPSICHEL
jgi:FkbM family methyltransferase